MMKKRCLDFVGTKLPDMYSEMHSMLLTMLRLCHVAWVLGIWKHDVYLLFALCMSCKILDWLSNCDGRCISSTGEVHLFLN
jgi:hypothetical protein